MVREIELTHGLVALVDDEIYDMVSELRWHAQRSGGGWYAVHRYQDRARHFQSIRMHRVIAAATIGQLVDHINGNTLDNRRCNLRLCNNRQNSWNRKRCSNNTSGYKGVYWDTQRHKWCVHINGKYVGRFTDVREAARAYNAAALELHGEFARLNEV